MKSFYQLVEAANEADEPPDRWHVEWLPNGLIRVFDRGSKTHTLFERDLSLVAGVYSKGAELAAKKFLAQHYKVTPNQPVVPHKKKFPPMSPFDVRLQPSRN